MTGRLIHSRALNLTVPEALHLEFVTPSILAVVARSNIHLIDIANRKPKATFKFSTSAFTRLGTVLLAGNEQGQIITIDTSSSRMTSTVSTACRSRVNTIQRIGTQQRWSYGCQNGDFGVSDSATMNKLLMRFQLGMPILSMAASQDGRYVVTGGQGGKMHIFDLEQQTTKVYAGQSSRLPIVSAPSEGFPYFASGDDDGYIRIWNTPQSITRTIISGDAPFFDCLILEDGTVVAIGAERNIRWWNERSNGQALAHAGGGIAARKSPDAMHFATFGYDGTIILWSSTPSIAIQRRWLSGSVTDVEFMPDGLSVVSSGEDGRLLLWHNDRDEPELIARFSQPLTSVELAPSKAIAITAERDGSIWAVNIGAGEQRTRVRPSGNGFISRLIISPDEHLLGVGSSTGDIALYSTKDWTSSHLLKAGGSVRSLNFSPDMSLVSAISDDGYAYLLSITSSSINKQTGHWNRVAMPTRSSRFSPNGALLVNTTSDGGVYFYSIKNASWRYVPLPTADIFGGRFSSDATHYAAVDSTGHVTLFDITGLSY